MANLEESAVTAKEEMRESIRNAVRDSIDNLVEGKTKAKGYVKEDDDKDDGVDVNVNVDADDDDDDEGEGKDKKKKKDDDKKDDDKKDDEDEESDRKKVDESFDQLMQDNPELYFDILETVALIEEDSGELVDLTEASRRKAAAIGFALGGLPGAAVGASFAKGKQRTLQGQIDGLEKKIQKWKQDPQKNKKQLDNAAEKLKKWKAHLQMLTTTGTGDAGMFRTKYKDKK